MVYKACILIHELLEVRGDLEHAASSWFARATLTSVKLTILLTG